MSGLRMSLFVKTCFAMLALTSVAHANDERSEMILLNVDKKTLNAQLMTLPEAPAKSEILREFRIAIGKVEGDKIKSGDNKTPEGIYFAQRVFEAHDLPKAKYGPLAIPLNFPNPIDLLQAKTGHGIWLHGVGDRNIEDAKVTEGCVAFPNGEISKLASWLKPGQGLVSISTNAALINAEADVASLKAATLAWTTAWAERKLDAYIANYAEDFMHDGKNKDAFREYKGNVFRTYEKMDVKMSAIRFITHPKYALAIMNQDFNGDDRYILSGRKALYWTRGADGQWKIQKEVHDAIRLMPVAFGAKELGDLQAQVLSPVQSSFTAKR